MQLYFFKYNRMQYYHIQLYQLQLYYIQFNRIQLYFFKHNWAQYNQAQLYIIKCDNTITALPHFTKGGIIYMFTKYNHIQEKCSCFRVY